MHGSILKSPFCVGCGFVSVFTCKANVTHIFPKIYKREWYTDNSVGYDLGKYYI